MGLPELEIDPADADRLAAVAELAAAVRRVVEATVRTELPAAALRSLARDVEVVGDSLSSAARPLQGPRSIREVGTRFHLFNPVIGPANPYAPPLVTEPAEGTEVRGSVTLGAAHEGPPGYVHGGIVAALLDQLLGHAAAATGLPGMTASLTVRFRRPTPYGCVLSLAARQTGRDGRKVYASAEIRAGGEVTADATALFLPPPEGMRADFETTTGRPAVSDCPAGRRAGTA